LSHTTWGVEKDAEKGGFTERRKGQSRFERRNGEVMVGGKGKKKGTIVSKNGRDRGTLGEENHEAAVKVGI